MPAKVWGGGAKGGGLKEEAFMTKKDV